VQHFFSQTPAIESDRQLHPIIVCGKGFAQFYINHPMGYYLLCTAGLILIVLSYLFYTAKKKKKGNRGID
jgi:hypothetical protein